MATKYAFENLLRQPYEYMVGAVSGSMAVFCFLHHNIVGFSVNTGVLTASLFGLHSIVRILQGRRITKFKKSLSKQRPFAMSTAEVPVSKEYFYNGRGFKWDLIHRQRLALLSMEENRSYIQDTKLQGYVRQKAKENENGLCALLQTAKFLPFKPLPPILGKPWLHGVGFDSSKDIYTREKDKLHEIWFGRTQVGKTRKASINLTQDIRNGYGVGLVEPKGDLEVAQDMYLAAKEAGRLDDLIMIHPGFPEYSAKYNPLAAYSDPGEVADRVTSGIDASGSGSQFKDFAWDYTNITARVLHELGETISYMSIGFYITRPELLLLNYADKILTVKDPDYADSVEEIMDEFTRKKTENGEAFTEMSRSKAILQYVKRFIEGRVASGDMQSIMKDILIPLYDAARTDPDYYKKITISVIPALNKINQTSASDVFSWDETHGLPVLDWEQAIKQKKIVYLGLDSLTNPTMAEAIGKAVSSDLISVCGRLYKDVPQKRLFKLHLDEFNSFVGDAVVQLLNKSGGAGIKVTAYTQTVNDIGAALGNKDKAEMILGNFGTIGVMMISNRPTAEVITSIIEKVKVRTTTPSSMSNDHSDGNDALFTSSNTDQIAEKDEELISINDLYSLPKGQAFVITNGGEIYKLIFPLPKNDGTAPPTFETLISEVNLCYGNAA